MSVRLREDPLETVRELAPLIRADADEAERQGHLTDRVVEAITDAGLYKLLTPRALGGSEADPLSFYRVVEEIARADGSTGWCYFIQAGGTILGASLPDATAAEIFGEPDSRVAGSVFPFGRAGVTADGFSVSGRWSYASGCWHATWFVTFCAVHEGDTPRPGFGDMPELRAVLVPRADATIHETWDVSGLAGTGSHDLELVDVPVPERRTWRLAPGAKGSAYEAPMYRMPFIAFFGWPMAAVALGIAQSAIDAVMELADAKTPAGQTSLLRERPLFQMQLAQSVAKVRSARAWLHACVERAHDSAIAGPGSDMDERGEFLLAAVNATQSAREAVELAYGAGGGTANYRSSRLQRCLRDIHAVTQHIGTSVNQYPEAGRLLLGMPPGMPIILL